MGDPAPREIPINFMGKRLENVSRIIWERNEFEFGWIVCAYQDAREEIYQRICDQAPHLTDEQKAEVALQVWQRFKDKAQEKVNQATVGM